MHPATAERLRPHQRQPVEELLAKFRAGARALVDLSDMGIGKTYTAAAVAHELQWPTLVVAPLISLTAWERAAAHFGDKFSLINYEKLATGRLPYGTWENQTGDAWRQEEYLFCHSCQREVAAVNPEPCYTHSLGLHCVEWRKRQAERGKFVWNPAVRLVIFDEIHRCAGLDTHASEMLIATKRQGIPMLGLSATAACSPLQLRALGYCLGLHTLVRNRDGSGLNFYEWARRYGVTYEQRRGWKWMKGREKQIEIMASIRQSIIPRAGVRVTTDEVPGFPECDVTAELYDINDPERLDALYAEMADAVARLDARAASDLNPEHPLTKIIRALERIELLKVPIAVDLADDYVAKGYSVALFVNFQSTLRELMRKLDTDCFIDGSPEGVRDRWKHIDHFQADKRRKIVVNSKAGGVCVSLHDVRGEFPRVGLAMPTYSAVIFRQLLGRLRRDGGMSKSHYRVMFAAKTAEVAQHRALSAKLDNLDALNDEDLAPANLILTPAVLGAL
jgi:superfamily II DNA or RNA helicase